MRPTECPRCEEHFTPILKAEARIELVKTGESAAQALVDEKLEGVHADHSLEATE